MPRILVVDDDPLVCEVVTHCLREEMHAFVDCALNGSDGALLLKGYRFDLAVIDAALPGIDGLALAELAANENTAVLLTSGHPEFCERFDRFNFPHLTKPFDLSVLVEEAAGIIRDTRENIRRVRAAAAEMRARTEALAAKLEISRQLVAGSKAAPSAEQ